MKPYYCFAVAAMTMAAACSDVEDSMGSKDVDAQVQPQAIGFDAYVKRGTTRAGFQGELTSTTIQGATAGFGVMAYYTDDHPYQPSALPNFMYNQKVLYNETKWEYSPVKYWPNETGPAAASEATDYLSFFAYAPYVDVTATTGCVPAPDNNYGIVAISRPTDSGNPYVRYIATTDPSAVVDLCWATPQLNQTKPAVASTVDFSFQHALAALNVQIDADIDVVSHAASSLDGNTRIWVRSVTFDGFALKGELNLNNSTTTPDWHDLYCNCALPAEPITIYDGRRDGREGIAAAANEGPTGLNTAIVQSVAYTTDGSTITAPLTTAGVTNTAVNLFNSATATAPIYVIPNNDELKVTIAYDVETYDPKLVANYLSDARTHGSSIENVITATTSLTLAAGKMYTINLHLGMTSVKATATVSEWPAVGESANVEVPQ